MINVDKLNDKSINDCLIGYDNNKNINHGMSVYSASIIFVLFLGKEKGRNKHKRLVK